MNREVPKSRSNIPAGPGDTSQRDATAKHDAAPKREAASKREAMPSSTRVTNNNTGRVKFDDRGNAVWEWAVTTGAFGTDVSTQRLKKLENHTLSLADDVPSPSDIAKQNPRGVAQGYSPYDSGLLMKETSPPKKKTDLKRLSEWLKLREQANRNKKDE